MKVIDIKWNLATNSSHEFEYDILYLRFVNAWHPIFSPQFNPLLQLRLLSIAMHQLAENSYGFFEIRLKINRGNA